MDQRKAVFSMCANRPKGVTVQQSVTSDVTTVTFSGQAKIKLCLIYSGCSREVHFMYISIKNGSSKTFWCLKDQVSVSGNFLFMEQVIF